MLRGSLALLAVAAVAALWSANASAETVIKRDAAGREIHFDVRASGVDVDWYASLLSRAAHADEISTVTIRIVDPYDIHESCGRGAAGCYFGRRSPTLTVPAGRSNTIASIFLHEYGHHVDTAWRVSGASEPNGSAVWWALRGMAEFRRSGAVVDDYRLGWNRGVGEIFAEDYAYIHLGGEYGIPWLYPPNKKLKQSLLAELRGESVPLPKPESIATMMRPVHIDESGILEPGATYAETFRLLGPGRRVTLTAAVSGAAGARAVVTCDGSVVKSTRLAPGRSATLDLRKLGPAECSASVVNTAASPQRFSFRLRLAVQV
jgi:hypothetical protein